MDATIADLAGNALGAPVDLDFLVPESFAVDSISPRNGDTMVSLTREIRLDFSEKVNDSTIDADSVQVIALGSTIAGNLVVSSTDEFVTFFPADPWSSSTEVLVMVDGDLILAQDGDPLDADGDGLPGGTGLATFRTLPITRIAGTNVSGFVKDSTNQAPVVGATIRVDAFPQANAVTDANGFFTLTDMPAPEFFVHIDGSTATNAPSGFIFPNVGKPFHSSPGEAVDLDFDIFLPPQAVADAVSLSPTQDTDVGFGPAGKTELVTMFPAVDPAVWDSLAITFAPNSAVDQTGVPATEATIVPVPPSRLPAPLPGELDPQLVISIQAAGATNFDVPAPITFPNIDALPSGEKVFIFSFDHDAGEWTIVGTGTVSPDETVVESDPGVGIRAPGWHFVSPPRTQADLDVVNPWEDKAAGAEESFNGEALNTQVDILLALGSSIPGPVGAIFATAGAVKGIVGCPAGDTYCIVKEAGVGVVGIAGSFLGAKAALTGASAVLKGIATTVGNVNTAVGLKNDVGKFSDAKDKLEKARDKAKEHGADPGTVDSAANDVSGRLDSISSGYVSTITQALDQADQLLDLIENVEKALDDGQGGTLDPADPNNEPPIRGNLGPPEVPKLPDFKFFFDVGDTFNNAHPLQMSPNSQRQTFEWIGSHGTFLAPAGVLDVDMWAVDASAGEYLNIGIRRSGAELLRSYLRLFDPAGNQVASNVTSGPEWNPFIGDFLVPTTGTYFVGVSGYDNTAYNPTVQASGQAGYVGPYSMLVQRSNQPLSVQQNVNRATNSFVPSFQTASTPLTGVFGGLVTNTTTDMQASIDTFNTAFVPLTTMAPMNPVFVALENTSNGQISRSMTNGVGRITRVLLPNTTYNLYIYDPVTDRATKTSLTTGSSGSTVRPPSIILGTGGLADTDGDKLLDIAEIAVGTSINSPDTDNDKIGDLAELRQGLDPLNPASFPTGVIASLPLPGQAKEIVLEGPTVDIMAVRLSHDD